MPPRIARSGLQSTTPKAGKNKNRKRNLDAFSIASHSVPEKRGLKPSRFGEFLDDRPKSKRRREENDGDSDEEREAPLKRRRAVPQDEDEENGSDSSGNEWTLGGLKEDDSDSDIDSDEAFGESDEEKFEGFAFRGSKTGTGKKISKPAKGQPKIDQDEGGDIDLGEDGAESEEEEEDDFGDEGVDLATMLDDEDEEMLGGKDTTGRDMGEDSASDEEEEEESADDADSESSEDGGDEEERVARMRDRIDAMDASARHSKNTQASSQPAALTVEDLLADLDPAQQKQFASALKTKKKSQQPQTLTAPLPKRQQDKLNREEASKKAKEQLDRWRDTVIRNRRAEFLSFPLNDPNKSERMGKDRFIVGDEQAPANELEENIRKIMEESGLATKSGQKPQDEEDALLKAEDLATNKLPVEEVLQRRAELRRARELLFREEIKAKRIKKIKSKAYRRVHRKQRQRQEQDEQAERGLYGEADLDETEQEKFERKRAEARMSTKHKDSKFAKALKQTNRGTWDEGAREAVIDEARRREELKRRIHGEEISDDNDDKSDVPSDDEDDSDGGNEESSMMKQLDSLKRQDGDHGSNGAKGLSGLKFMQAADERRRAQNDEDIARLRKEMAVEDGDEEESDDEIDDQGLGRAVFGPKGKEGHSSGTKPKKPEMEEGDLSDDEENKEEQEAEIVTEKPTRTSNNVKANPFAMNRPNANGTQHPGGQNALSDSAFGGWTDGPKNNSTSNPRSNDAGLDKAVGESAWLSGTARKDKKRKGPSNGRIVIDTNVQVNDGPEQERSEMRSQARSGGKQGTTQNGSSASNTGSRPVVAYDDGNAAHSDGEAASHANANGQGAFVKQDGNAEGSGEGSDGEGPADPIVKAKQQADHFRRAFAMDDAIKPTFDAEKEEAAESEGEKEVSHHLPGWGSWAGHGLTKTDKKANARQKHNPLYKTKIPGVKRENRKDAKLDNVIISEKQNRKGKNYMAPILPHGFENKAQYERSLRLPMGPEWSTKEVHQRATRPRVVVKPGTVVEAMEKPLA